MNLNAWRRGGKSSSWLTGSKSTNADSFLHQTSDSSESKSVFPRVMQLQCSDATLMDLIHAAVPNGPAHRVKQYMRNSEANVWNVFFFFFPYTTASGTLTDFTARTFPTARGLFSPPARAHRFNCIFFGFFCAFRGKKKKRK